MLKRIEKFELLFALALLVGAVFFPILNAGYLPWDDDVNVFTNPIIRDFDIWRAWKAPYYGVYVPVDLTVWSLLYKWSGGSAVWFRAFSLALHFLNCVLLYRFMVSLLERRGQAISYGLSAALILFAVHPLQVGTVAWISGQRDLLAATFSLATVLLYFSRRRGAYWWACLFFIAALLSKPSAVVVPVAVFAAAWIFEREKILSHVKKLAPWLLASVILIVVTHKAQSGVILPPIPWWFRPLNALDSFGFHLQQLFWPWPLAVDYGRTPTLLLKNMSLLKGTVPVAVAVGLALWWYGRREQAFRLGWLWFLLLLPVSGIVSFAFQENSTVADHYQYLSMAVVAVLLAMILRARVAIVAALVVSSVFALSAHRRVYVWADEEKFFLDMHAKNPSSFSAAIGIGNLFFKRKDFLSARAWYEKALVARPTDVVAVSDYAAVLGQMGRHKDIVNLRRFFADPEFQRKANLSPRPSASLLATMGSSAAILKDWRLALKCICTSAKLEPANPDYKKNVTIIQNLTKQKCP